MQGGAGRGRLATVHEWLEKTWLQSSGSDQGACQALILAAGTYQHLEYGRVGAARKMALRALDKLVRYRASVPRFVNVDRLITKLETLDPTPPQLGAARLISERSGKHPQC